MTTTTIASNNPFAAYCPAVESAANNEDASFAADNIPSYRPPSWITFFHTYFVRPFRNTNSDSNNALVADWMQGGDKTGYALSVVAAWCALTAFLLAWLLVVWVGPRLVRCCRTRRRRRARAGSPG